MAKKVKKIKDTDYLFLSAYIHAKESGLIGRERLERMLEARSPEDALKVLEECGWPSAGYPDAAHLEQLLANRRGEVFADMGKLAPDPAIVNVFRVKYDYHNIKVMMKSQGNEDAIDSLMLSAGRFEPKKLKEDVLEGNLRSYPTVFSEAYIEASDVLARTADPQISDFILDRAYFTEFLNMAEESASAFLKAYARLSVDVANLKSVIRAARMKKDETFLKQAVFDGGNVRRTDILRVYESPEMVPALFKNTELKYVAEAAENALKGGKLTEFEKLCDNALLSFLSEARKAGFNEKPLVAYLCSVENEINAIRIVMTGQFSGLKSDDIKGRLRDMI